MITLCQRDEFSEKGFHAEWPEVVGGRAPGRESDDEVILYIALGIWGEYTAIFVYRKAMELGLGIRLPVSSAKSPTL